MKKKILGLDFDDVLLHCFKHLLHFNNTKYGSDHVLEDFTSYQPMELWGCDYAEVMRRVKEFHESDIAGTLEPIEGAVEAITKLADRYELVIVTMRPPETEAVTRKLLEQFPDVFGHIHFLGSWDGIHLRNKADICKEIGATLFIDDGLHNAEILGQAGIPVLLFDSPWNQTDELPPNVKRVFSWDEILAEIENNHSVPIMAV